MGALPGRDDPAHRRGGDWRLASAAWARPPRPQQFHWWDYRDQRYLDALRHLGRFAEATARSANLALTHFEHRTPRDHQPAWHPIVSNQVQYSLVDRRPAAKMASFCTEHGITPTDLRHAVLAASCRKNISATPSRCRGDLTTASLGEIQADDRRLGRLGRFVPGAARRPQNKSHDQHAAQASDQLGARATVLDRPRRWRVVIIGARLGDRGAHRRQRPDVRFHARRRRPRCASSRYSRNRAT